jgi:hypothetical protein
LPWSDLPIAAWIGTLGVGLIVPGFDLPHYSLAGRAQDADFGQGDRLVLCWSRRWWRVPTLVHGAAFRGDWAARDTVKDQDRRTRDFVCHLVVYLFLLALLLVTGGVSGAFDRPFLGPCRYPTWRLRVFQLGAAEGSALQVYPTAVN